MQTKKHYHFVGIKGVAMTALAVWAKQQGIQVTGSDLEGTFPTESILVAYEIPISIGFSKDVLSTLSSADLVIYTGAHGGKGNPQVVEAQKRGIPVVSHAEALGVAMSNKRQVAVAGCHGKTTTTAMLATIAQTAQIDSSYVIGAGQIRGLGLPAHNGSGDWFIAEADEYVTDPQFDKTPRFLWMSPEIMIVTNIDYDHPDVYSSLEDVQRSYIALQQKLVGKKITVLNADDLPSQILATQSATLFTYGKKETADYQILDIKSQAKGTNWVIKEKSNNQETELFSPLSGEHIAFNASSAAIAARHMGISWASIGDGLRLFEGASRRFEEIGEIDSVLFIDDYAHHPTEIRSTISACRNRYPKRRVVVVFQPHTYSRTEAFFNDFETALKNADVLLVTGIYGSAREASRTIDVSQLIKHHPNGNYAPSIESVEHKLHEIVSAGDIVLFLGAGDIYEWGRRVVSKWRKYHG